MKKAWIENNQVRDICSGAPAECYHPDVAVHFDTDVPDDVVAGATWNGGAWVNPPPETSQPSNLIEDQKRSFIIKIDSDADAIYAKALGNRATEYAQAEIDATAYKAAGYTGTVPYYVQAWATATGKSAAWATDDIIATSTAWRNAMAVIRLNRLSRKEDARKAVDVAALEVVKAQWAGFVTAITTQLGV